MYTNDTQILDKLLLLIEQDDCQLALKTWADYKHQTEQSCNQCPYKAMNKDDDCCMCLESKLRTLSLYEHNGDALEQGLQYAARRLDLYHRESERLVTVKHAKETAVLHNKIRALVIDDDEDVRFGIRLALEHQGYDVNEACNGTEGILLQEADPFNIAIIDMIMPVKNGLDTIKELTSKFPDLGILAISGGTTDGLVNDLDVAKIYGATAILRKPFKGDDLIGVLDEVTSSAIRSA